MVGVWQAAWQYLSICFQRASHVFSAVCGASQPAWPRASAALTLRPAVPWQCHARGGHSSGLHRCEGLHRCKSRMHLSLTALFAVLPAACKPGSGGQLVSFQVKYLWLDVFPRQCGGGMNEGWPAMLTRQQLWGASYNLRASAKACEDAANTQNTGTGGSARHLPCHHIRTTHRHTQCHTLAPADSPCPARGTTLPTSTPCVTP